MAKFQHGFNIVLKLKQSFLSLQPEMGERYGGRVGQGKLSHFTFNCQAVNQNKRQTKNSERFGLDMNSAGNLKNQMK